MWIQSSSGILLYNILQNIAEADYGTISDDLRKAVRMISSGEREMAVLEKVTSTTRSENFKKALWHITAAMRTGVGLNTAIKTILDTQTSEQHRAIREYSTSLNFVLLLYLMFAAVAPAILTTFFALLSIFGVFAISCEVLIGIVIFSAVIQLVIIGFMRTARPGVY
jgi:hypothetical protein